MEARYVFHITYHPGHEQAQELIGFLKDVASCSDKLSCRMSEIENPVLEFTLLKDDMETGIKFRGDGEWLARKHGASRRRQWRKVHIAMDAGTGDVRAVEFTSSR